MPIYWDSAGNSFISSKEKVTVVICVLLCLEYLHLIAARTNQ